MQSRDLRRSHIIPEFLHKPIYDELHQTQVIGVGMPRARTIRKGVRETLLCEECEGRLQKFEDYFARSWCRNVVLSRELRPDPFVEVQLDYSLVKLFLLSIVWRASVSRLEDFAGVRLGPHEEKIRQMLLEAEPGESLQYPIYAGLIWDARTRLLWDNVLSLPIRVRFDRRWAYRMVFAGASWTVIISGRGGLRADLAVLNEDGSMKLTVCDWGRFAELSGAAAAVRHIKE
jgi:hypothetical protein